MTLFESLELKLALAKRDRNVDKLATNASNTAEVLINPYEVRWAEMGRQPRL